MVDVNLIEDNGFLDKDVSELVLFDFYLFHINFDEDNPLMYYWYNNNVLIMSVKNQDIYKKEEYSAGTLRDFITKFA